MENLEQIVAQNLTELRKSKKWTQAELAEKINYSDKSVSKWERGEALPDLKVLAQMAELFGVTLDFFVTENAAAERASFESPKSELGYRIGVELLAVCAVWLVSLSLFLFGSTTPALHLPNIWMALIWAVPASALIMVFFSIRWKFRITAIVFESILCWTTLTSVFLQLLVRYQVNLWHLFLIGIPLQGAIILWAQVRKQRR
ncbi:MAG: helix-turn-helix transcriptional regulator [Ruminococcaceae bacterium]|nr:helix-turn-helix transcriptional regulator [Oscillospiraceae bacterium]